MEPLLRELGDAYSALPQALDFARAGGTPIGKDAHAELARYPDEEFTAAYGGVIGPLPFEKHLPAAPVTRAPATSEQEHHDGTHH